MKPRLYLVDAHAYLHRAYHALPPLTNSRGEHPSLSVKLSRKNRVDDVGKWLSTGFLDFVDRIFSHGSQRRTVL